MRVYAHTPRDAFDFLHGQPAEPMNDNAIFFPADDCGFESDPTCAAIQDVRDSFSKLPIDVVCGGRTDISEGIGAWRGQRKIDAAQELLGKGMRRTTEAGTVQPRCDQVRYVLSSGQQDGQRTRPMLFHQVGQSWRDFQSESVERIDTGDMNDQRVEYGARFHQEYPGNRLIIGRIAGQSVNRFGRYPHQSP